MQASLCSTAVDLSKHPVICSSVHQTRYCCVSLHLVNLPSISKRPQQAPLLNGREKSRITDDVLWSWLAGPLFCQNRASLSASALVPKTARRFFMTAADTVTGSAIEHAALGCAVSVSWGTRALFCLSSKQQQSSCCTSLFA